MKQQNVQCLRIIGCLGVVLVHLSQCVTWQNPIMSLAGYGARGVYLFFLISGYVTFLSLEKIEHLDCVKYYKGRMIRILPLYYIVILYWFILHQFILRDTPGEGVNSYIRWFRYVFMVNCTLPTDNGFWKNIGATWTMSCFALFYLLVPLMKKYIKNFNHSLILWIVLLASGNIVMKIWNIDNLLSVGCLHYFVFGIVAYYAVREGRKKERTYLLVCEIGTVISFQHGGLYNETLWLMLFGVILVTTLDVTIHNRVLQKTIGVLDEYTYDIYLIHPIFVGKNLIPVSLINDNWGKVVTLIIGVTITALLIHNLIEKPIQKRYASSKR